MDVWMLDTSPWPSLLRRSQKPLRPSPHRHLPDEHAYPPRQTNLAPRFLAGADNTAVLFDRSHARRKYLPRAVDLNQETTCRWDRVEIRSTLLRVSPWQL